MSKPMSPNTIVVTKYTKFIKLDGKYLTARE
jgi:hypothetical protein